MNASVVGQRPPALPPSPSRSSGARIVSPPNPLRNGGGRSGGPSPPPPPMMADGNGNSDGANSYKAEPAPPPRALQVIPRYPPPPMIMPPGHHHPMMNAHRNANEASMASAWGGNRPYHPPPPPHHPPMHCDYPVPPPYHGRQTHGDFIFRPGPPHGHHHHYAALPRAFQGPPPPPPHCHRQHPAGHGPPRPDHQRPRPAYGYPPLAPHHRRQQSAMPMQQQQRHASASPSAAIPKTPAPLVVRAMPRADALDPAVVEDGYPENAALVTPSTYLERSVAGGGRDGSSPSTNARLAAYATPAKTNAPGADRASAHSAMAYATPADKTSNAIGVGPYFSYVHDAMPCRSASCADVHAEQASDANEAGRSGRYHSPVDATAANGGDDPDSTAASAAAEIMAAEIAHGTNVEEEEKDKLAAVDAIFAAAEVIAKRPLPSPPPPGKEERTRYYYYPAIVHHGTAPSDDAPACNEGAIAPAIVHHGFASDVVAEEAASAPILRPKRPIKKRKVQDGPAEESPENNEAVVPPKKKIRKPFRKAASPDAADAVSATTSAPSPERDRTLASRALFLGRAIEDDPALYRTLLLHMALERETPRKPAAGGAVVPDRRRGDGRGGPSSSRDPSSSSSASNGGEVSIGKRRGNQYVEGVGTLGAGGGGDGVIADGFFWKDVPELEGVLQRYMEEYYEMSENRPQSKKQQQFNNRLVHIVYRTALQCRYTFDPLSFGGFGSAAPQLNPSTAQSQSTATPASSATKKARRLPTKANKGAHSESFDNAVDDDGFNYKKLRDRIRCYYKTHVQNSKKRLITLLKNPTRPKNQEVLVRIVDDIRAREAQSDDVADGGAEGGGGGGGMGTGSRSWHRLSPNSRAALRRLEARERAMGFVAAAPATPTTWARTPGHDPVAPEAPLAFPPPPCGDAQDWSRGAGRDAPQPPPSRRVSVDVRGGSLPANGDEGEGAAPSLASPCKPEHAAMLRSIRSVSVQL